MCRLDESALKLKVDEALAVLAAADEVLRSQKDKDAIMSPSGRNCTQVTGDMCPLRVATTLLATMTSSSESPGTKHHSCTSWPLAVMRTDESCG